MPTEAEWEDACYAGKQTEYCGGDDLNAVAWYVANSRGTPHPVGQKQPNGYGLYDMSGNLWQWTADCHAYTSVAGRADGGTCYSRFLRGGSWSSSAENARSSHRAHSPIGSRDSISGFRLARTVQ